MTADDACLWPDGSWCFFTDIMEYSWKGDDFEVIPAGTARWIEVCHDGIDFEESTL